MKQAFVKKIAAALCTVMILCSVPFNLCAFATEKATSTATDTVKKETNDEIQQKINLAEELKKIISSVEKFVVAISAYLEEQEKMEQGNASKTPPSTENDSDLSRSGIAGYLYDSEEKCFYTASDPWQRVVGYNELFDVFSEVALIDFDTIRFKFDYKKENWMIQIWKGQYGLLFYGAEIGVYKKPTDRRVAHYDAVGDEDRLRMSMDFYEYKEGLFTKDGWEKKFSRPYGYYWWCTGFIPGNRNNKFDKLRVDARITARDYDMLSALTKSIKNEGIKYKVKGLDIIFTYQ